MRLTPRLTGWVGKETKMSEHLWGLVRPSCPMCPQENGKTQLGSIEISNFYLIDNKRYQRIGMSVSIQVDSTGKTLGTGFTHDPLEMVTVEAAAEHCQNSNA